MLRLIISIMVLISGLNIFAYAGQDQAAEEWNPVSVGPLNTWTSAVCAQGDFLIQPFFYYNRTRGSFDADGKYHGLGSGNKQYQFQEQLFVEYGITDKLEIAAQTVYQQNYAKAEELSAHQEGFGDSYLFLRYCAFEDQGWLPSVTGLLQLKLPTGKYQHLDPEKLGTDSMGTGSWDPGFGFNFSKKFKPFLFHADVIFSFPQKVMVDGVKTKYASNTNYNFAVEYFLPKGFNLMLEAVGYLQRDTWQDGGRTVSTAENYLMVIPGIGWACDKVQFLLAYQRVVSGVNTDANDSVVLTGTYTF